MYDTPDWPGSVESEFTVSAATACGAVSENAPMPAVVSDDVDTLNDCAPVVVVFVTSRNVNSSGVFAGINVPP